MAVGLERSHPTGDLSMYLLYEHHKDPSTGAILATDMLLTSFFPGSPRINFRSPEDKALFELCKLQFKSINAKDRSIDMDTYIWSFFGTAGKQVYDIIKASPLASAGIKFEAVQDLASQRKNGFITRPVASAYDPNDFFYNPQGVSKSSGPSKDQIVQKLGELLELSIATAILVMPPDEQKRRYRTAAMKFHPDRNNGDGSKMADLNYYWQAWQPYAVQS